MKILLTGARGFTGQHFVRSAEAAGHAVVPLDADLTQASGVAAQVAALEFDAVVHLAAISFVGHADDRAFYDVNLFGTLNLLDAIKSSGRQVRRVLVASSANVYGNCEHSPIAETQAPAPVNHYAMSKLAMECMARARVGGLPLLLTRPFNYTGPGQGSQFVIPKLVDHYRRKATQVKLGNLAVEREYNDVRFLCEAYLRLLEHGQPQTTYNVCTGQTYDLQTVIGLLSKLTGHTLEVNVDPGLVRANEIQRLCGDPAQLVQSIGALPKYTLEDTLAWMMLAAG